MRTFDGIPRHIHRGVIPGLAILSILIAASVAFAHAVSIWAYVEKGHVYVEAYFSSGSKVQECSIFVLNAKGEKLLEGKTDKEGNFDFVPPVKENMTIVLDLGNGHRSEFTIKAEDFKEENTPAQEEPAKPGTPSPEKTE